jgi:hypothetical protein
MVYYLPIYFQAIHGNSAVRSGINTLPLVLSLVCSSIMAGIITKTTGYYVPQVIASSIIMSIGAGLLTTLTLTTGSPTWIGYQILFGFGLGLGMQQANMAAQVCLDRKDVFMGVALMFFMQGFGGSIFISVGQQVFTHSIVSKLKNVAGLSTAAIVNAGATDLRGLVPADLLETVLVAYNEALSNTFKVAVACAVATILTGMTMEWRNMKGMNEGTYEKKATKKKSKKEVDEEKDTVSGSVDGADSEKEATDDVEKGLQSPPKSTTEVPKE